MTTSSPPFISELANASAAHTLLNMPASFADSPPHESPESSAASAGSGATSSPTGFPRCQVCGDKSISGHRSYGAIACSSCKAFFRRAHQKTRTPKLVCQFEGDCEMNIESRRLCSKCRYDKCLAAGMRPEYVLSAAKNAPNNNQAAAAVGDKNKKSNKRQKVSEDKATSFLGHQQSSNSSSGEDSGGESVPVPVKYTNEFKRTSQMAGFVRDSTATSLPSSHPPTMLQFQARLESIFTQGPKDNADSSPEEEATPAPPPLPLDLAKRELSVTQAAQNKERDIRLRHKEMSIRFCWNTAVAAVKQGRQFETALVAFHRGKATVTKQMIQKQLAMVTQVFYKFGAGLPDFTVLDGNDLNLLWSRNVALLISYLMGQYFSQMTGEEQARIICLEDKTPGEKLDDLPLIDFQSANEKLGLLTNIDSAASFAQFIYELAHLELTRADTPLVAYLCLTQINRALHCQYGQADLIYALHLEAKELLNRKHAKDVCTPLMYSVSKATSILSSDNSWRGDNLHTGSHLNAYLSPTEIHWLATQRAKVQSSFSNSPYPLELVKSMILMSMGRQLDPSILASHVKFWQGRILSILKTFQEFNRLPSSEQGRLWRNAILPCWALIMAKVDRLGTLHEQLEFAAPASGYEAAVENYNLRSNLKALPPVTVARKSSGGGGGVFNNNTRSELLDAIYSVNPYLQDPYTFDLFLVSEMFSPSMPHLPGEFPGIERLGETVSHLLQKQLSVHADRELRSLGLARQKFVRFYQLLMNRV